MEVDGAEEGDDCCQHDANELSHGYMGTAVVGTEIT